MSNSQYFFFEESGTLYGAGNATSFVTVYSASGTAGLDDLDPLGLRCSQSRPSATRGHLFGSRGSLEREHDRMAGRPAARRDRR